MALTGYKVYTRLKKVSDDGLDTPLDQYNIPISQSGEAQDTKLNSVEDPDYVAPILDPTMCPVGLATSCVDILVSNSIVPEGPTHPFTITFSNRPTVGSSFTVTIIGDISGHSSYKVLTEADLNGSHGYTGDTTAIGSGNYISGESLSVSFSSFNDGTYIHNQC